MNETTLSANTFSIMEEHCQDDSFTEDKVCVSETAVTTDNGELLGFIWHSKIKQYEESTCLDNIKIELPLFEATEVQNDSVKVEGGLSPLDVRIEFDNGLLYCEHCKAYYEDYCIECGMLEYILNKNTLKSADRGARKDISNDILEIQHCFGQTGIYALRIIPAGVKFGPFTGLAATEWPWEMEGEKFVLDEHKSKYLNWMQYVNPTRNTRDQNLHVIKSEDNIYYQSTRQIQAGDELLVYFGEEHGNSPNKTVKVDFVTTTTDIGEDIFACTFCCLGFSSKLHLVKHKTVCVEDTARTFLIEELTQCPYCKIYLDPKEYFEHHMAFCCERNARNSDLAESIKKIVISLAAAVFKEKSPQEPTYTEESVSDEKAEEELSVWNFFKKTIIEYKPKGTITSRAIIEVQRYLEDDLLPRNGNPLDWWRSHSYNYPVLSEITKEKCCALATSVPCERLFSKAGLLGIIGTS